ncbi:MAG: hypothetical protein GXX08_06415 [Firmicutes bacterium]|nr:hypothetical protein [Bacillota bacterium]
MGFPSGDESTILARSAASRTFCGATAPEVEGAADTICAVDGLYVGVSALEPCCVAVDDAAFA